MYDYYLRCKETDFEQLVTLATMLGVIEKVDNEIAATNGGVWDYIGYKYIGPELEEGGVETREVLSADGVPYVHVNVRTSVNVREVATVLATENPLIAEGLAQIPRFFITDGEGNATVPEFPLRVWL